MFKKSILFKDSFKKNLNDLVLSGSNSLIIAIIQLSSFPSYHTGNQQGMSTKTYTLSCPLSLCLVLLAGVCRCL